MHGNCKHAATCKRIEIVNADFGDSLIYSYALESCGQGDFVAKLTSKLKSIQHGGTQKVWKQKTVAFLLFWRKLKTLQFYLLEEIWN